MYVYIIGAVDVWIIVLCTICVTGIIFEFQRGKSLNETKYFLVIFFTINHTPFTTLYRYEIISYFLNLNLERKWFFNSIKSNNKVIVYPGVGSIPMIVANNARTERLKHIKERTIDRMETRERYKSSQTLRVPAWS